MAELLNIRFSFLCRSTHKNQDGLNPIVLRVIYRSERRDIFTGLYCPKKHWNPGSGTVWAIDKSAKALNQNLALLYRRASEAFEALQYADEEFSIDQLVDKIKGKEERPTLLIDFLEDGIKRMKRRVGVEITQATFFKYRKSLEYVREFLQTEFKVKNFILARVDQTFIERYFEFLRTTRGIGNNTAIKYIVFVKTAFRPAIRNGFIKCDPFSGLRYRMKPVNPSFLTMDELKTLETTELKDPDLARKRDIFLFACYTGLAYVDLKQLRPEHIQKDSDDCYYIRKPRQKTGEQSIIPLLPLPIRILRKYSQNENFADLGWYISSNQKMNQGLKFIGKRTGLKKDLHMHMARHTFATTVTLSNGVPMETVSKMLGHANIKQTQHYARVVADKIKLDMAPLKEIFC